MLLDLPEDVWRNVALHLAAPEILNFLSTHSLIHRVLSKSDAFWKLLLERDCESSYEECSMECAKRSFLCKAYMTHLPSVRWYPIQQNYNSGVSPREGHIACVLGPKDDRKVIITGGFTDDSLVYVLHTNQRQPRWTWDILRPEGPRSFVYGATLTALDEHTALRFGGFRSGGYSDETNQVALLSIRQETENGPWKAEWKDLPTQNSHLAHPRAYHTATLIQDRYLVIIGGMMWRESIIKEAILDTNTWTWVDRSITSEMLSDEKPSGRHGHSVVLDSKRNRLVLFGGGSGTDLLRSGVDNSEVWELQMGVDWKANLLESLPWTWRKIFDQDNVGIQGDEDDESDYIEGEESNFSESAVPHHQLFPADALCLGRCHNGIRISLDTVLFTFGSGRPSTNGVLAYDLQTNSFIHPTIQGPLPRPRFTGVAALLEADGYVIVHGGYTTQDGDAIGDMCVLDLAPSLQRTFDKLQVDPGRRSYGEVTNDEAVRGQHNRGSMFQRFLQGLPESGEDDRQLLAANVLSQMIASGGIGTHGFFLVNMIANGSAILRGGDESSFDDEDGSGEDDNDGDDDAMVSSSP